MKKTQKNTKKLIIVGAIAGGILVGCFQLYKEKSNNFTRVVGKDGSITMENAANYDVVKDYELVEIETILGTNELFLTEKKHIFAVSLEYNDVFTGKTIYSGDEETNTKLIKTIPFEDYLIAYGVLKEEYTSQDLLELLEKIKADYQFTTDKQLTKNRRDNLEIHT